MSILKNLEYRSSSDTVFTLTLTQVGDNIDDALFFSTTCGSSSAGGASPSCVAGTSTAAPGAPAGPAGVAGDDSAVVAEAAVVVVAIVGEVTLFNSGTESSLLSRIAEYKYITRRRIELVVIATNPSCPRCVRSSRQPPAFAPQRPRRV